MKELQENYLLVNSIVLLVLMNILQRKYFYQNSLLVLLFLNSFIRAQTFQNLIPNGSFETYTQCPTGPSQLYNAAPWTGPSVNSSDYNNSCSSIMNVPYYSGVGSSYPAYLLAKDGQAYAGIWYYQPNDVREYAQVELLETLKNGSCYFVEFYAANSQWVPFAANNLAANLSAVNYPSTLTAANSLINIPSHITNYGNPILKDTVKWEKISGIYKATGNEKYMIIGNFRTNAQTDTSRLYPIGTGPVLSQHQAYAFIDAVSVYSIDPHGNLPWTYRDTIINQGESVFIGNKMGGLNFHPQWFTFGGTYIATNAGIVVSPTITSSYIVQYTLCGIQKADTIKVTVIPEVDVWVNEFTRMHDGLKIYPVPANEKVELRIQNEELFREYTQIVIYDRLGQMIREEEIEFKERKLNIGINDLSNGVYSLTIKNGNNKVISKRFVITR